MCGPGHVEINLKLQKKPKKKVPTALDRLIWATSCDHQNVKVPDQDMTQTGIESFLGLYGMWNYLVGITCLHPYIAIYAQKYTFFL